jgi:hypothetical protein
VDRLKSFAKDMAELGKLVAIIGAVFGFCVGVLKLYAYGSTRADAGEVAVLKSQRTDDVKVLDYILHRVDNIGDQLNHMALTGRVNYVPPPPPPAPPTTIGPQLPVKGDVP